MRYQHLSAEIDALDRLVAAATGVLFSWSDTNEATVLTTPAGDYRVKRTDDD
jgi:hypothetical protein